MGSEMCIRDRAHERSNHLCNYVKSLPPVPFQLKHTESIQKTFTEEELRAKFIEDVKKCSNVDEDEESPDQNEFEQDIARIVVHEWRRSR